MSRARLFAIAVLVCTAEAAPAKFPPLSDEAKAKAAEAAAKTAWSNKVSAYQLCKAEDRVAARYMSDSKKAGKDVKPAATTPPCTDPGPFVYTPPAAATSAASSAPAPAAAAPTPPAATPATPAPAKKS